MAIKLLDFTTKSTPEAGDFVYTGKSGATTRDERKIPIESMGRLANPRGYIEERVSDSEKQTSSLGTSGWYTIAETDSPTAFEKYIADFRLIATGASRASTMTCHVETSTGTNANRPHSISIYKPSSFNDTSFGVASVRIAKSNVSDSGVLVQAYVDVSTTVTLRVQMLGGMADGTKVGFSLLDTFVLDNAPTLPDGVTAATFVEAGAIFPLVCNGLTFPSSGISAIKVSNDAIRIQVDWMETPKQNATTLTVNEPGTSITVRDGSGTGATVSGGSYTISNLSVTDSVVSFTLNLTGAFTSLNTGPLAWINGGTDGDFTLS